MVVLGSVKWWDPNFDVLSAHLTRDFSIMSLSCGLYVIWMILYRNVVILFEGNCESFSFIGFRT